MKWIIPWLLSGFILYFHLSVFSPCGVRLLISQWGLVFCGPLYRPMSTDPQSRYTAEWPKPLPSNIFIIPNRTAGWACSFLSLFAITAYRINTANKMRHSTKSWYVLLYSTYIKILNKQYRSSWAESWECYECFSPRSISGTLFLSRVLTLDSSSPCNIQKSSLEASDAFETSPSRKATRVQDGLFFPYQSIKAQVLVSFEQRKDKHEERKTWNQQKSNVVLVAVMYLEIRNKNVRTENWLQTADFKPKNSDIPAVQNWKIKHFKTTSLYALRIEYKIKAMGYKVPDCKYYYSCNWPPLSNPYITPYLTLYQMNYWISEATFACISISVL